MTSAHWGLEAWRAEKYREKCREKVPRKSAENSAEKSAEKIAETKCRESAESQKLILGGGVWRVVFGEVFGEGFEKVFLLCFLGGWSRRFLG